MKGPLQVVTGLVALGLLAIPVVVGVVTAAALHRYELAVTPWKRDPGPTFVEVPALVRVDETTAYFKDGTSKRIDAIILCTGYKHHFPFLPDDIRLKTANRLAANRKGRSSN